MKTTQRQAAETAGSLVPPRLRAGAAIKKKTVVALARQLAIDLWRWRTGRATLADLGWVAARTQPSTIKLISLPTSVSQFATGRQLLVAAAGEACFIRRLDGA